MTDKHKAFRPVVDSMQSSARSLTDAVVKMRPCPDCTQAKVGDPPEVHSHHCIAGLGPTCEGCFCCRCGQEGCTSRCFCPVLGTPTPGERAFTIRGA